MPAPSDKTEKLQVVLVGTKDLEAESIRRQVEPGAEIVATVEDASAALEVIRERRPGLALLFLDHARDAIVGLARQLSSQGVTCVVVSRDREPDTILLAMRSGARDFAYLDGEEADVRRAVAALSTGPAAKPKKRGTVIGVFSCKGGSGATTIATNLAGALLAQDEQRRVVIVDLDAQMGDVMLFLDVVSRYSWTDLLHNLSRLDDELLHRSLTAHASGIRIVAQDADLEDADRLDPAAVTATLEFLREHYDYVIVDGLRDFNELALAALDAADRVAVTLTQDVPALKNANRTVAVLRRLGYRAEKIKLIVNRYHKRDKLDLDTISDALGMHVDATVANDYHSVVRAINEGQLLVKAAPHAEVTHDINELVYALELAPRVTAKRRWFGRQR